MVLGERLAQRRAGAHATQDMARDGAQPWVGRQLFLDGERAVEGEARFEERGELLGEGDELAAPDATRLQGGPGEAGQARPLLLGPDLDGEIRVVLEPLDDAAGVGGLHHAIDGLPPLIRRLVREDRHAGASLGGPSTGQSESSCVSDNGPTCLPA